MFAWLLLAGCKDPDETDTDTNVLPDVYWVDWSIEPDPPVAGETGELTLAVKLGDAPVQDLQQTHERMVHTLAISRDLESFQHVHQEDFEPVTADDLRTGTFHFPITFPAAGDTMVLFDYAAQNQYLRSSGWITVTGSPEQLAEPDLTPSAVATDRDIVATLVFDTEPAVGQECGFHVSLADEHGEPIGDVVQWLGADAHAAIVSNDLEYAGHTHAYVQGMENAPPSHEMPHLYDGPDIPLRYTFPASGTWKMWFQFAREADPDAEYTVPFVFVVP